METTIGNFVSHEISKLEKKRDKYKKYKKETSPEAVNLKGEKLVDVHEKRIRAITIILDKFYKQL